MLDELSVERAVATAELVAAVAKAAGVDRERIDVVVEAGRGDFARRVAVRGLELPRSLDRVAFFRALAQLLATRLLVDDGELDPHTALLVTADDAVRVNLDDDGVITGLHHHVDTDDVPDRLALETATLHTTRGAQLARVLAAPRALDPGEPPEVQDAEHALVTLLGELVHRPATPDDERVLRRTCAVLRRANVAALAHILRCADDVLAGLWDPAATA